MGHIDVRNGTFVYGLLLALGGSALGCAGPPVDQPDDTVIRAGMLIDPGSGTVLRDGIVAIAGGRITYVGMDTSRLARAAQVIDWSNHAVIPGLIDAHTHICYAVDETTDTPPWERLAELTLDELLPLARENALAALRAGVTSAIDKGCWSGLDLRLRDEIERGQTPGPRLFVAGPGLWHPLPGESPGEPGAAADAEALRAEIQRQAGLNTDLVKMWADMCSGNQLACEQDYTRAEMQAAASEAHRLGKPIAIHAYHGHTARDAVLAGADSVEHSATLSADTIAEMRRRGTLYVPTIDHNRYYRENRDWFGYSDEDAAAFDAFIAQTLETTRVAHQAGVRIAMGSDAVFTMFGENTRELSWLMRAGMTPMEALRAATVHGAMHMDRAHELGAIAPGYRADLIAIAGDPLADIEHVIRDVRAVMKDGELVVE